MARAARERSEQERDTARLTARRLRLPAGPRMTFAHPSEQAFASLLDSYGIRWEYEPRMFVLERDSDGNTSCGFTPDFYLPDFDMYVELTTLRQRLVNRKKQKLRLLAETHPGVRVKLLNRRDMEWIGRKYGLPVAA